VKEGSDADRYKVSATVSYTSVYYLRARPKPSYYPRKLPSHRNGVPHLEGQRRIHTLPGTSRKPTATSTWCSKTPPSAA
jgi:hypothetical protein